MSSVLDALTPEERAEVVEALDYRRLDRMIAGLGLAELLDQTLVRTVPITTPAAGSDFSVTVPAGSTWEILSFAGQFVTSATVANRIQGLIFTDNTVVVSRIRLASTVTATSTVRRSCWVGAGYTAGGLGDPAIHDSLPAISLPAGATFASSTLNIDATDAWAALAVYVRERSPSRIAFMVRSLLTDLDSAGGIRYLP